jgi:hypothetical protein
MSTQHELPKFACTAKLDYETAIRSQVIGLSYRLPKLHRLI